MPHSPRESQSRSSLLGNRPVSACPLSDCAQRVEVVAIISECNQAALSTAEQVRDFDCEVNSTRCASANNTNTYLFGVFDGHGTTEPQRRGHVHLVCSITTLNRQAHFVCNVDEIGHHEFSDAKQRLCIVPAHVIKNSPISQKRGSLTRKLRVWISKYICNELRSSVIRRTRRSRRTGGMILKSRKPKPAPPDLFVVPSVLSIAMEKWTCDNFTQKNHFIYDV
jgi:hypothetical protein